MRKLVNIIEDLDKGINMEQLAPIPKHKEAKPNDGEAEHDGSNTGTND